MPFCALLLAALLVTAACGSDGAVAITPPDVATDARFGADGRDTAFAADTPAPPADVPAADAPDSRGTPPDTATDGAADDAGAAGELVADAGPLPACGDGGALPTAVTTAEDGRAFTARCGTTELLVKPVADGVVRLRYTPSSGYARASFAVRPDAGFDGPVAAGPTTDGFAVCTPTLVVEVALASCTVRVHDEAGAVLFEDGAAGGYFERRETLLGAARDVVGVSRLLAPDEHVYGLGEKTGPFDKRGRAYDFWNTDAYNATWGGWLPDTDPLYASIPFYVALRDTTAYGVLTDDTFRMRIDVGAADPTRLRIAAAGGAIDQYVVVGPTLPDVLRRYTALTGRAELPPRWALGYHHSRWGYGESEIRRVTEELRARDLPVDSMWLDIQHMRGYRSFTWDLAAFPDPAGLVRWLFERGLRAVRIVDPGLLVDPAWDVYADGLARGCYLTRPDGSTYVGEVWAPDAVFPDFTSAVCRAWWASLVPRVLEGGVEGVWIDMNEPSDFNDGGTVPDEIVADGDGDPMTMAEVHNVYGLLEAQATREGFDLPDRRPFVLTRAGYAGIQRYAALWTGDAPSDFAILRVTVPMLLGLGLSGVPFVGSDVGGYSGQATAELFARWMQVGVLSPFFRAHTMKDGHPQEPWVFGPEVEAATRDALRLRYTLLPYFYTLFYEATRTGAPLLRPLVWEFPEDAATHTRGEEAMLGPSLLFAPVLEAGVQADGEGEPNHSLYLPAGRWYELHSGRAYDGPTTLDLRLPLGALPAFVREGAILPLQAPGTSAAATPAELLLDVYPAATETRLALYADDGLTRRHEDGAYSLSEVVLASTSGGARLDWHATSGDGSGLPARVVVRVRPVEVLADTDPVLLDGLALPAVADRAALDAAERGYWLDRADRTLLVALPRPALDSAGDGLSLALRYTPPADPRTCTATVPVTVRVPAGTPHTERVHVVTSANWGLQVPLEWSPGFETASGSVEVPCGEWFFYKYTRGTWETVEKTADCAERGNRAAFGAARLPIEDTVATWRDLCE